jgi:hypothetical protein
MTTTTATATKQFAVIYFVTTAYQVMVERPENITEADLLESVTREDLCSAEEAGGWDGLTEAWKNDECEIRTLDEDGYVDELATFA